MLTFHSASDNASSAHVIRVGFAHFSVKQFFLDLWRYGLEEMTLLNERIPLGVMRTSLSYLRALKRTRQIGDIRKELPWAWQAATLFVTYGYEAETEANFRALVCELFDNDFVFKRWRLLYDTLDPIKRFVKRRRRARPASKLYYAALIGLQSYVSYLLMRGVSANETGGRLGNALQAASYRGHINVVKLLLEHNADVNARGGAFGNALQAASSTGNVELVNLLLENRADVNAMGGYFGSAFQAASVEGHKTIVHLLVTHDTWMNGWRDVEVPRQLGAGSSQEKRWRLQ